MANNRTLGQSLLTDGVAKQSKPINQAELFFCLSFHDCMIFFVDFCRVRHWGGFGSMDSTATGCADDLPTFLGTLQK
jgi:hypothetical protein